jgi:hypothetical protein
MGTVKRSISIVTAVLQRAQLSVPLALLLQSSNGHS